MKQKHKYIHYSTHVSKIHSNTETSNQTIPGRKANSLSWILIYSDLAQLICSISRKQWAQTIFRYNKFLKKSSCDWIGIKLKLDWHSLKITGEPVQKIFMKNLVIVNSSDCLLRDSSGHVSVAYNNIIIIIIKCIYKAHFRGCHKCAKIGKHLECSWPKIVSLEAKRPILPYTPLNVWLLTKNA